MSEFQPTVDEKSIFELDPVEIKVNKELGRQRKDLGEINKMIESIKTFGQLQPVVINRNNELIAGGRRLAACMMGGFKVKVCYKDTIDPLTMREMELEENIQRKALTPSEEVLAVAELVELKQKIHGVKAPNREGGFSQADAAEILGKSRTSVVEDIKLAEAIKMFPELRTCATKNDIKKAVKSMERAKTQVEALSTYEETIKKCEEFILVNRDAVNYLAGIGDATVDLFFSDPPYGLNIHSLAMTVGGETGGSITTTNTKYDDSEDYVKTLLERFATESFRVTNDAGYAYIFCAPSHFAWLSAQMAKAGWLVAPRPVVWIKRESGQNNQPEKWFSSAYEFILFARKSNSVLVLQGRPDWIQCDPVLPSERVHQAEKPIALCKELIARTCLPSNYVLDPCMGSGAIVEAAVDMKMLALGCEKDTASYASAVARMVKWKEKQK
jgi:ParB/RepB/Spo0J family partition protein